MPTDTFSLFSTLFRGFEAPPWLKKKEEVHRWLEQKKKIVVVDIFHFKYFKAHFVYKTQIYEDGHRSRIQPKTITLLRLLMYYVVIKQYNTADYKFTKSCMHSDSSAMDLFGLCPLIIFYLR